MGMFIGLPFNNASYVVIQRIKIQRARWPHVWSYVIMQILGHPILRRHGFVWRSRVLLEYLLRKLDRHICECPQIPDAPCIKTVASSMSFIIFVRNNSYQCSKCLVFKLYYLLRVIFAKICVIRYVISDCQYNFILIFANNYYIEKVELLKAYSFLFILNRIWKFRIFTRSRFFEKSKNHTRNKDFIRS